ncbi:hypothetical protein Ciccas_007091 [Cichlidogyrus casuarinus]|uniref:Uncharacterized protein n=1 Tax=Cichlidogyrus casuarinus TaxID=1844966 RepID=A0ABD2Q3Z4_9PLAT
MLSENLRGKPRMGKNNNNGDIACNQFNKVLVSEMGGGDLRNALPERFTNQGHCYDSRLASLGHLNREFFLSLMPKIVDRAEFIQKLGFAEENLDLNNDEMLLHRMLCFRHIVLLVTELKLMTTPVTFQQPKSAKKKRLSRFVKSAPPKITQSGNSIDRIFTKVEDILVDFAYNK